MARRRESIQIHPLRQNFSSRVGDMVLRHAVEVLRSRRNQVGLGECGAHQPSIERCELSTVGNVGKFGELAAEKRDQDWNSTSTADQGSEKAWLMGPERMQNVASRACDFALEPPSRSQKKRNP